MVRRTISRKKPGYLKFSLWAILVGIIIALVILIRLYTRTFGPSIELKEQESVIFYIPTGTGYEMLSEKLADAGLIDNITDFEWLAERKNLRSHIYPGRYRITDGMSMNELINLLRSGKQEPVLLSFHNIRNLNELAESVSLFLEPDSAAFASFFNDASVPAQYGFSSETFPAMFIPNTYEFYWNTTPDEFTARMKREYVAFWSGKRMNKAEELELSPEEVITLASIVDQETLHDEENETIAGVFINRLRDGIPLQSDPTIIYAHNNFEMKRVWNKHKNIDSPYNTYKYRGLPPGPISIPSISAIDGVLNYEDHNYIFFCAKPDFSGYHNFARTLSQHNQNARLYQKALDRRKIY